MLRSTRHRLPETATAPVESQRLIGQLISFAHSTVCLRNQAAEGDCGT
jgi:hypothetical protein